MRGFLAAYGAFFRAFTLRINAGGRGRFRLDFILAFAATAPTGLYKVTAFYSL